MILTISLLATTGVALVCNYGATNDGWLGEELFLNTTNYAWYDGSITASLLADNPFTSTCREMECDDSSTIDLSCFSVTRADGYSYALGCQDAEAQAVLIEQFDIIGQLCYEVWRFPGDPNDPTVDHECIDYTTDDYTYDSTRDPIWYEVDGLPLSGQRNWLPVYGEACSENNCNPCPAAALKASMWLVALSVFFGLRN